MKRFIAVFMVATMLGSLTGSLGIEERPIRSDWETIGDGLVWYPADFTHEIPNQEKPIWLEEQLPWWERSVFDKNNNYIHDSIENKQGIVGLGISYESPLDGDKFAQLDSIGVQVKVELDAINSVLIGFVESSLAEKLVELDDVVMVHEYGNVIFYGDVQTQNVKARNSSTYPNGAWDFGVTGKGVNIAMVDTGVDNEHPGLAGKFVAGYDAVCYVHSDPTCAISGFGSRETDGSYDPDDGHQHGTACMGMAAATGLEADGSQSEFYGSAPDASLVDVRIGTDAGAGPFENYILEQEFYESAMNGLQWIIDNKDTPWAGVDESLHGIDIISLSWGITSHEGGGSDGTDMHSMILDDAMNEGVVVSVAAGNDGPDNDGLSGMGSSDLSITVGATDDVNTITRDDDTIASYSSRGPRRDNGDNNPLNELKPEVTAPGTNIIQAEGCVTQGGCSNLISDASGNTYTSRGSGTSYATPSVSGILALMIEANPDLDPFEMKEILKFTAERKGEPTQPDVDPYWNRDFGWGIVDAYKAVELAIQLRDQQLTGAIDVFTQVHLESANYDNESGLYVLSGIAWGQMGSVTDVEYKINDGSWNTVAFEETNGTLGSTESFVWTIALDLAKLSLGNNTVQIRGVSDSGESLPIIITVQGEGLVSDDASGLFEFLHLDFIFIVFGIILIIILFNARISSPEELLLDSDDSITNVLQSDEELASVVDAELLDQTVGEIIESSNS